MPSLLLSVLFSWGYALALPLYLRPASDLSTNCYDFPKRDFNLPRCVECMYGITPKVLLRKGEAAIDFTLKTYQGEEWTLATALADKPVFLVFGMYTCPDFHGTKTAKEYMDQESKLDLSPSTNVVPPPMNAKGAFWDEADLVERFSEAVTFVHIIGPEPHPLAPNTNFDKGVVRETSWSTIHQPKTYSGRRLAASLILDMLHPESILLLDSLPEDDDLSRKTLVGETLIQPVWCSYVNGARGSVLIGTDGIIRLSQGWFDSIEMALSIEALLLEQAGGSEDARNVHV